MTNILVGSEVLSNLPSRTQVYLATHDGAGKSLPYMNKSFISFTFGGRAIEDFNLIVVNASDRMERNIYASFTDLTSTYDTLDGQLYWGSKFEPNQLDLTLATDEITEQQIDNFKEWFAPGKVAELILSEHPNRAIYARVAAPPKCSFLPFEKNANIIINNISYSTKTTVYRGEVSLNFIMDEPYWFAKINYMPKYIDTVTLEEQPSITNENCVETLLNKDMLKIMLEDGLPHQYVLSNNTLFLGGNKFIHEGVMADISTIDTSQLENLIETMAGLDLNTETSGYLFYSGTAPSYPIIQFELFIDEIINNQNLIISPKNKIAKATEYSYIKINDSEFYFTTPSMLTGYNQVIKLFTETQNLNKTQILLALKTSIHEYYVRAWAIKCVEQTPTISDEQLDFPAIINNMKKFFSPHGKIIFKFNSKTGEAIGIFNIINADVINENTYMVVEENVGDMVRSNYLVIEGRNYLNSQGAIDFINDCSKISTNEQLHNVLILFKNMYL